MSDERLTRFDRLPLNDRHAIDRLCGRFEAALGAGELPSAEDFLGEVEGEARDVLRDELRLLEEDYRDRTEGRRGPPGSGHTSVDGPVSSTERIPAPLSIPGYEVLEELGRGGMGIVYKARHLGLNRLVALKMILAGGLASERHLTRFLVEGEMLARLTHPHIVRVYDVNQHRGHPFLALEYVAGGTLAAELKRRRPTPREAAVLVEQLARAVDHAHRAGVIHRDLKPANVLLSFSREPPASAAGLPATLTGGSRLNEVIPKITDFGLARPLDPAHALSETGLVVGTPTYMAPEQASGEGSVGPAADVYALGAILYESLTGRPPFRAETAVETLRLVLEREPTTPRTLEPSVPRDLETICLKCLEKAPARRYAGADALADDLGRFLHDEPIAARPVGRLERVAKWARRHPAPAALSAAVVLAVVAGFVGVSVALGYALAGWNEAEVQFNRAEERRREADDARQQAEISSYFSAIARARLEWRLDNVAGSAAALQLCPPERRGWEWRYLDNLHRSELLTIPGAAAPYAYGVAFSPDGRAVAAAGGGNPFFYTQGPRSVAPGEASLFDARSGRPLHRLRGHANVVSSVAFTPDGATVVTAGFEGTVKLWDPATGRERRTLGEPVPFAQQLFHHLAVSPDGRRLAAVQNSLRIWDLSEGKLVLDVPLREQRTFHGVAFGPDGHSAAVLAFPELLFFDLSSGKQVRAFTLARGLARAAALSPDGKTLAVAADRTVELLAADTGRVVRVLSGHSARVRQIVFGPDGRHVATAGDDLTVRLWDARDGTELLTFRGHRGRVASLAFHPDGHTLAAGDEQPGDVKLWDLTRTPEHVAADARRPQAIHLTDDGRHLLLAAAWFVRVVETESGRVKAEHPLDFAPGMNVVPSEVAAFAADGRRLATIAPDFRRVQLWRLVGDDFRVTADGGWALEGPGVFERVTLSRDGGRAATLTVDPRKPSGDPVVRVWDLQGRSPRELLSVRPSPRMSGRPAALVLSPDGRRLAYDDSAGTAAVRIHDIEGGQSRRMELPGTWTWAAAFDSAGGRLAAASAEGGMGLWNAADGAPLWSRPPAGPETLAGLAFGPPRPGEHSGLLAGTTRDQVHLWDVSSGQEVLTLRGAPVRFADIAFNPRIAWSADGQALAASHLNTVTVWADGAPRRPPEAERAFLWHLKQETAASDPFYLTRLRAQEPPDDRARAGRATVLARAGLWEEARSELTAALEGDAPALTDSWVLLAHLHQLAGDREGYRRVCRRMAERYGDHANVPSRQNLAWAWASSPDLAGDPARAVALCQRSGTPGGWGDVLPLLPLRRTGQHRRAAELFTAVAERNRSWTEGAVLWAEIGLALRADGRPDEARPWLEKVERAYQAVKVDGAPRQTPPGWITPSWLHLHLLLREAGIPEAEPPRTSVKAGAIRQP